MVSDSIPDASKQTNSRSTRHSPGQHICFCHHQGKQDITKEPPRTDRSSYDLLDLPRHHNIPLFPRFLADSPSHLLTTHAVMSLTLHQSNLSSSSHPCGQSWHHTSNVDISLLLKPRERDDNESALASPVSPLRVRDHDISNISNDCDAIPSPPQSVVRTAPTSAIISTTTSKQHQQPNPHTSPSLAPPARTVTTTTSLVPAKRSASHLNPPSSHHHNTRATDSHPAKKQSKWSPYEDSKIISLRAEGMKWEDISRHLPGRSAISCRLHYQNYLERRSEWDEDRKDRLARLYER